MDTSKQNSPYKLEDNLEKRKLETIRDENDGGDPVTKKQRVAANTRPDTPSVIELSSNSSDTQEGGEDRDESATEQNEESKELVQNFEANSNSPVVINEHGDWIEREDFDNMRARLNEIINEKRTEIEAWEERIDRLETTFDERVKIIEDERNEFQAQLVSVTVEKDNLAKNQEEYNKKCMAQAMKWKQSEIDRRIAEVKWQSGHQHGVAERKWQRKFDTQKKNHSKEQQEMKDKVKHAQIELKAERQSVKDEKKMMKDEQTRFLRDHKPENTQKIKDLEKSIGERDQIIAKLSEDGEKTFQSAYALQAQLTTMIREAEGYAESAKGEEVASELYKAKLQSTSDDMEQLKFEHQKIVEELKDRWDIQQKNAHESAQRAVCNQRISFVLRQTNDKLTRENEQLRLSLEAAQFEAQSLENAKQKQHKVPAEALSKGSNEEVARKVPDQETMDSVGDHQQKTAKSEFALEDNSSSCGPTTHISTDLQSNTTLDDTFLSPVQISSRASPPSDTGMKV